MSPLQLGILGTFGLLTLIAVSIPISHHLKEERLPQRVLEKGERVQVPYEIVTPEKSSDHIVFTVAEVEHKMTVNWEELETLIAATAANEAAGRPNLVEVAVLDGNTQYVRAITED